MKPAIGNSVLSDSKNIKLAKKQEGENDDKTINYNKTPNFTHY